MMVDSITSCAGGGASTGAEIGGTCLRTDVAPVPEQVQALVLEPRERERELELEPEPWELEPGPGPGPELEKAPEPILASVSRRLSSRLRPALHCRRATPLVRRCSRPVLLVLARGRGPG